VNALSLMFTRIDQHMSSCQCQHMIDKFRDCLTAGKQGSSPSLAIEDAVDGVAGYEHCLP
jgi:hypothetical protein